MTLPALSLLRQSFEGAEISIITPPGNSRLLASTGYVDKIIEYHRKERGIIEFLALRKRLSGERFELSVLFQNAFEAALLVFLAGIPHRIGFASQHRRFLLTHPVSPRPTDQVRHQVFDYIDLVNVARSEMGSSTTLAERQTSFAPPMPVLRAGDVAGKAAIDLLHDSAPESEPRAGRPLVALNPGATNSEQNVRVAMPSSLSSLRANLALTNSHRGQAERDLADRITFGAQRLESRTHGKN
jgi:ADP-heptose:LPS heptosyltransferase